MVSLVIGLSIGVLLGSIFAAIIARGKRADQYDPLTIQSPEQD